LRPKVISRFDRRRRELAVVTLDLIQTFLDIAEGWPEQRASAVVRASRTREQLSTTLIQSVEQSIEVQQRLARVDARLLRLSPIAADSER